MGMRGERAQSVAVEQTRNQRKSHVPVGEGKIPGLSNGFVAEYQRFLAVIVEKRAIELLFEDLTYVEFADWQRLIGVHGQ